ncbi:TonB-dependent hemoglobin/transferrin/lactoferrin family receptor [Falsiroseomonas tokyonensis]|uniref:TonB-dependent hemoglobin/transferrin/lactoferrin family receptor n=1 Tax=Falsiroseomonas tokyonensis TaxID=430521 RepID=A0ABV7BQY0_9PROT|nr:TonB-dependent hemoglobin/transferrin/lactoferrin family receptor [Falsiroseomonas tokyonensis]MBU8537630.1 TonB-dependent hemoglobin/transferrin/lactoferrin family receptor [Falsiroseomonas tokyonensis]
MAHRRLAHASLTAAILALAATPASAQQAAPASTQPAVPAGTAVTPLDAVTTTATRTPAVSGDVAAPVTVVGREEIERRDARSVVDLIRDIPGIESSGAPRTTALQPIIRGLGDERIVLRTDGARNNFNAGHRGRTFVDPDLLRQVEVLRGPASTLYGSGALGGAISLRTIEVEDILQPGAAFGGTLGAGWQSQGSGPRGSLALGARAGDFSLLGAVAGFTNNNFTDGADNTIPYTGDNATSLLGKLSWNPGHHRFQLSALRFRDDHQIPISANTATTTGITDRDTVSENLSFRWSYDDPALPLFNPQVVLYRTHVDLTEQRLTGTRVRDRTELTTVGIDAQNTSRFGLGPTRHALTFGTELYRDEQEGTANGVPRQQFPSAQQSITAFFVQDEIGLGAFTLTPGVRLDRFEQESPDGRNDRNSERASPRISLAWQVTPWLQPYVSYAEGFRAPSLTELYVGGQHFPGNSFVPNPNLRPEVSRNKEVGANLRFSDVLQGGDRLRIRVAAFRNDIDDFIEQTVLRTTTVSANVAEARIEGVEAEAQYDAGLWYAGIGAAALKGDNRVTDQPLASIPAHRVTLSAGYRFLEHGVVVGGRITATAEQDRAPNVAGVAQQTSGYGLLDLHAAWTPNFAPNVRLSLAIDNVFDQAYRRANWNSDPSPPFYDVGRNIRGALRVSF